MSEYIIKIPNECFSVCDGVIHTRYYPDERHDPMPLQEIVRCRDCREYNPELYRHISCELLGRYVEPDDFCSWSCRRSDKE